MYKAVIGLEIHIELNTKSKMFSPSKNSYDLVPNVNVTPIDIAYPGTMPYVNKKAIESAIKLSLALNSNISDTLLFDRKNYYYPDLPKGFQITQLKKPLGQGGYLEIDNGKKVLIHELHVEEDAASFVHETDYSLIDYNRVGVPLIEVVTEPCMNSSKEAIDFLESLRNIIKYLEISDADQSKGQIRCDVNVSLMKETDTELGVRSETKNINSFSSVKEAIEYEIKRQTELLENNLEVKRETRRYSDQDKKTYSMREKADALDYKYYVEPNIPETIIDRSWIKEIKENMPSLPYERKEKYINEYKLSVVDANTIISNKAISDYFESVVSYKVDPKSASNWICGKLMGYLNKEAKDINDIFMPSSYLADLIKCIDENIISNEGAKTVFDKILVEKLSPNEIIEKYNMKQVTDESEIIKIVDKVISEHENEVNLYRNGKVSLFGFFVGLSIKESQGKANPTIITKILKERL